MARYRVVLVDEKFPSYAIERSILEPLDASFETFRAKTPSEVADAARGADVVMVSWAPVTREVIAGLDGCRGIIRYGVGYETIDVEAASAHGIPVINVPDYCTDEVADQALTFVLSLARKLVPVRSQTHAGVWQGSPLRPIRDLKSLRLGLLGIGRIGRAVIERARPFGFRIAAHDPFASDELFAELGVDRLAFAELLATSDVLSLHLPLSAATHHVVDRAALAQMPKGAMLVNVSRGGLVDEAALADALTSGALSGAAMDVFEQEPIDPSSPLLALENFTATSHYAWYSEASFDRLQRFAALEAARLLQGEPPKHVVNRAQLVGAS